MFVKGSAMLQDRIMRRFQKVEKCDVLVVAGEVSGDEHAAALVQGLKAKHPALKIAALGGHRLADAGAVMLDDLTAHARVGIWEVLKHLHTFMRLIRETIRWIAENKPRRVIFVDFVGFNLEVAKGLFKKKISRKGGGEVSLYFYISPQVWAWKAKRRFKIARWIDSLGTIFPFEPACYKDTTLQAEFVGHPFLAQSFENPLRYDSAAPILLLPGSRTAIVKKHTRLLWRAFLRYQKIYPAARAIAYYANEKLRKLMIKETSGKLALCPAGAPIKASGVITTAGTISLLCALSGIPGAVMYKTDAATYAFGKSVYKKKYLGMPNILLDRELMREFWQERATEKNLADELVRLREDPSAIIEAARGATELRAILSSPQSRDAVAWAGEGL